MEKYETTHNGITVDGKAYTYHHTASRRGYCTNASDDTLEAYSGRYGVGYIRKRQYRLPSGRVSTQYTSISYYIA